MILIQSGYKQRQAAMKNRLEFISNYWETEKNFLMKYNIEQKKKNKKAQQLNSKLMQQEPNIKEQMCKLYVMKCFLNFNLKFSIWRIKTKGGKDCEEYYEEIEDRTQLLEDYKSFLFLKTDSVVKDGIVAASLATCNNPEQKEGVSPAATLENNNYQGFT
jgi:hypothetical protein